ncbi:ATP phosphoribosyltransferase regulatory subunit [Granulosicoccaceae sp. 1_MG-2023]|nr:ATP phosphoribosyltransferase regulatory subunit [Granulosicoccaceae sp. 1_MG-2023]
MIENRWILPEGVDELLPSEAASLEHLRRKITDLYVSWGYELIVPPFIEYLESLLTGTGRESDLQTFKLVDQLNGRTIGVRADMTPQIARIEAHRLKREGVSRLFYMGTTLRTLSDGLFGSRSPMQLGAELYGHAGAGSDAEIISLMLATLECCGAETVYLDLGHVGIFRGLAHEAGLSEAEETALFDMYQRKSVPELDAFIGEHVSGRDMAQRLRGLVSLSGDESVLAEAAALLEGASAEVRGALDDLREISTQLRARHADIRIHYDLSELRGYTYHTGVVFAAYLDGSGQEVARGGRYDDVSACFGRSRPATGFSTDLKVLNELACSAAGADHNPRREAILVTDTSHPGVWQEISRLRSAGETVACALSEAVPETDTLVFTRRLVLKDGTWKTEEYNHG